MPRNTYIDPGLDDATDTGGESKRRRKMDVLAPRTQKTRKAAAPPNPVQRRRDVSNELTGINTRGYDKPDDDTRRRKLMNELNSLPNRGLSKR